MASRERSDGTHLVIDRDGTGNGPMILAVTLVDEEGVLVDLTGGGGGLPVSVTFDDPAAGVAYVREKVDPPIIIPASSTAAVAGSAPTAGNRLRRVTVRPVTDGTPSGNVLVYDGATLRRTLRSTIVDEPHEFPDSPCVTNWNFTTGAGATAMVEGEFNA